VSALLRHVPTVPEGFAARFIAGGWREVERIYGARTDLLLKWIEMSGGEDLYARRRQHMREHGVKPFGRAGRNAGKSRGVDAAAWLDR
jgi:hypothetical protein